MEPRRRVSIIARQVAVGTVASYPSDVLGLDVTAAPKVIYQKHGPVVYVVINRPHCLNACDFEPGWPTAGFA